MESPVRLCPIAACILAMSLGVFGQREATDRPSILRAAKTWMYQIQDLDREGAIEALAATDYPLLVLEPGHNLRDDQYATRDMVMALRTRATGSERLLLAYADIGEAASRRRMPPGSTPGRGRPACAHW